MSIATITAEGRGATDRLLSAVAARLAAEGRRPVGVVKTITGRPFADHCDMDLQVLPDGPVIRITQDLGAHSASCRLDAGALEARPWRSRSVSADRRRRPWSNLSRWVRRRWARTPAVRAVR
ncbi:MAG: DUF2478 domain-containing protein [Rhodospirillaceae bacterium]|jgi:hypothetical protein|nr:DUF2478 domain-containing protein [Rhodospirillaceae bacterium]MBT6118648.1 DUF2478 domain-containing protein [Rhodospirillaceae bacterium]